MNKNNLVKAISLYHLNKIVEKVAWRLEDEKLVINFVTEEKDLTGTVKADIDYPIETGIGILNTAQLLKLLNITDDEIILSTKSIRDIVNLVIEDTTFSLQYVIADTMMVPKVPKVNELPDPTGEIEFDEDTAYSFSKALKALDEDGEVSVEFTTNDLSAQILRITIGNDNSYTNKIVYDLYCNYTEECNKMFFQSKYFKEILSQNKGFTKSTMQVFSGGLVKFVFSHEENIESSYFIVKLDK